MKELYDFTKTAESEEGGDALPELIVENFDEEQIWQEVDLQYGVLSRNIMPNISQTNTNQSLTFSFEDDKIDEDSGIHDEENEQSDEEEVDSEDQEEDSENDSYDEEKDDVTDIIGKNDDYDSDDDEEERKLKELLDEADEQEQEMGSEQDSEEELDLDKKPAKTVKKSKKRKTVSVLDDQFFSFDDMEKFVDEEMKRDDRKHRLGDDEEEPDDEGFNMWAEDQKDEEGVKKFNEYSQNCSFIILCEILIWNLLQMDKFHMKTTCLS